VEGAEDIEQARLYSHYVDYLLFDAKPQPEDTLPGGNARSFNWKLLQELSLDIPWFLSGGLDANNLAHAVAESGAEYIDVSSGVESVRGVKDSERIAQFLNTANTL
jgi:phosphoribosylanthranilate isomerase